MEHSTYLKFKKHIYVKELKHGEFLLLDTRTGIWIKTSISFKELYKIIKKGAQKKDIENISTKFYSGKEKEMEEVLESLRSNGFLEGYEPQFESVSLDKIKKATFLCPISTINKNKLFKFLERNFNDFHLKIILESYNAKSLELNSISAKELWQFFNGYKNWDLVIRTDWSSITEKLKDSMISNIQVNFNSFEKSDVKIHKKIKILEELKKEKNIELRYFITCFRKKNKKDNLSPLVIIPYTTYYFTVEDIFSIPEKNRYRHFVLFFKEVGEFLKSYKMGGNQLIKFFVENAPTLPIFLPISRESCGAGITNFYIAEDEQIYPCKYLKKLSLGNIGAFTFSSLDRFKEFSEKNNCRECYYLKLCGGICKSLQNDWFEKICKFYKKILIYYISNISLKILKKCLIKLKN